MNYDQKDNQKMNYQKDYNHQKDDQKYYKPIENS